MAVYLACFLLLNPGEPGCFYTGLERVDAWLEAWCQAPYAEGDWPRDWQDKITLCMEVAHTRAAERWGP